MDFSIPDSLLEERDRFKDFLRRHLAADAYRWYQDGSVPRSHYPALARSGWFGFKMEGQRMAKLTTLREAVLMEQLAMVSPGLAIATLVHEDLGIMGLWLFGSDLLRERYGPGAVSGETLLCLGNTESGAGSDAAGIATRAEKVDGGWLLNGAKSYVTSGSISDLALITAVTRPEADAHSRISMFLVDLGADGVRRKKLNKQVWIPSDLTRVAFTDVFIPEDHLVGTPGRGLQQLLTIFTHSRIAISALTLGTAVGAFELALDHARKRKIFEKTIAEHQAKAFESADLYAKMEASRYMLYKACWVADTGGDFRLDASMAKYLTVSMAREVTAWSADLFGAASVIFESPIHKYPMDAWAASLGEGTQDVHKLVIFRHLMARFGPGE